MYSQGQARCDAFSPGSDEGLTSTRALGPRWKPAVTSGPGGGAGRGRSPPLRALRPHHPPPANGEGASPRLSQWAKGAWGEETEGAGPGGRRGEPPGAPRSARGALRCAALHSVAARCIELHPLQRVAARCIASHRCPRAAPPRGLRRRHGGGAGLLRGQRLRPVRLPAAARRPLELQRGGPEPRARAGAVPRRRLRPLPAGRPRRLGATPRPDARRPPTRPAPLRPAAPGPRPRRPGDAAAAARGPAPGPGALRRFPAGAGAGLRPGGPLALRRGGGGGGRRPAGPPLVRLAAGARPRRPRGRLDGAGRRRLPAEGRGAAGLRFPLRRPLPRPLPQHPEQRGGEQPGRGGERPHPDRRALPARHRGRRRFPALARRAPSGGRHRRLFLLERRRVGRAHPALLPRRHLARQRRRAGRSRGGGAAGAGAGGGGAGGRRARPPGLDGAGGVRGGLGLGGAAGPAAAPHLPARGGGGWPAPGDAGARTWPGCRHPRGTRGVRHRGVVPLRRGGGGAGGERAGLRPPVPGGHLPPRRGGERGGLRGAGAGVRPLGDGGGPLGRGGGGRAPRHAADDLRRPRGLQRRPPRLLPQRMPPGDRGQQHPGHRRGDHLPPPQLLHPRHRPAAPRHALPPHWQPQRLRRPQPGERGGAGGMAAPAAAGTPQQALTHLPGGGRAGDGAATSPLWPRRQ